VGARHLDPVGRRLAVISAQGSVWFSGAENWCAGGSDLGALVSLARSDHP